MANGLTKLIEHFKKSEQSSELTPMQIAQMIREGVTTEPERFTDFVDVYVNWSMGRAQKEYGYGHGLVEGEKGRALRIIADYVVMADHYSTGQEMPDWHTIGSHWWEATEEDLSRNDSAMALFAKYTGLRSREIGMGTAVIPLSDLSLAERIRRSMPEYGKDPEIGVGTREFMTAFEQYFRTNDVNAIRDVYQVLEEGELKLRAINQSIGKRVEPIGDLKARIKENLDSICIAVDAETIANKKSAQSGIAFGHTAFSGSAIGPCQKFYRDAIDYHPQNPNAN